MRASSCALLAIPLPLLLSSNAGAFPKDQDGTAASRRPKCEDGSVAVVSAPRTYDLPVVGAVVIVDATSVKLRSIASDCKELYHPLPAFEWTLQKGTGAPIALPQTLTPQVLLNEVETYRVSLTVCPGGCDVRDFRGQLQHLEQKTFTTTIRALSQIHIPPETEPVLPPQDETSWDYTYSQLEEKCACGRLAGIVNPQWVLLGSPYTLLEGSVIKSRLSRKDNWLNHSDQDMTFHVSPDPPFKRLMRGPSDTTPRQSLIEVEWESREFPDIVKPTPQDRVSVIGYWISDCGHGFRNEIHPPRLVAVHRSRPVLLPPLQLFRLPSSPNGGQYVNTSVGHDVWVPGVVTDVWINSEGGTITDTSLWNGTALHTPASCSPGCDYPLPIRQCTTGSRVGDASIQQSFTFHIYLPHNPREILRRHGIMAPDVDLYKHVDFIPQLGASGPQPTIVTRTALDENGMEVTYLEVTIDLTQFQGGTYARRITAAWVYPDCADNWGLRKYGVLIDSLDVKVDGDSCPPFDVACITSPEGAVSGAGEWRFWINLNNTNQEWTQLIGDWCNNCIDEPFAVGDPPWRYTFEGRAWQTENAESDRNLGSAIYIFPHNELSSTVPVLGYSKGTRLWLSTSGYEKDLPVDTEDDLGQTWYYNMVALPEVGVPLKTSSRCDEEECDSDTLGICSGCAQYTVNLMILGGDAVPPSDISQEARNLCEAYTVRASDPGIFGLSHTYQSASIAHIEDVVLDPSGPAVFATDIPQLRHQLDPEKFALSGISVRDFRDVIGQLLQTESQSVEALLSGLRARVLAYTTGGGMETCDLRPYRISVPENMWLQYFQGINLPSEPADSNLDGTINQADAEAFAECINDIQIAQGECTYFDTDNDGDIDCIDFSAFSESYASYQGTPAPAVTPCVPVLYVDAHILENNNNGTTWTKAFGDLSEALTRARPGQEVWVASGIDYTPAGPGGNRSATFQLQTGIAIYGGFAGIESHRDQRDPTRNPTFLSGDLNGDDGQEPDNDRENAYHVVTGSGTDSTAVLDGFVITGGRADGVSPYDSGGAMYNQSGHPTVVNCRFFWNRASSLGGGVNNTSSSPQFENCTFTENAAATGGAVGNNNSSPSFIGCTFVGNYTTYSTAGAMYSENSSPVLTNCIFRQNSALASDGLGGGALVNRSSGTPMATNCLFDQNLSWAGGGAIWNQNISPTITNCTFSRNRAATVGGAIYSQGTGNATIYNSILWGNQAPTGPQIHNTGGAAPTVAFSCIQGWYSGTDNISLDPRFRNPAAGDLHLLGCSPARNAGKTAAVPPDVLTDLEGHPRVLESDVDMGAYEFVPGAVGSPDLDNDGDVDTADFALLAECSTGAAIPYTPPPGNCTLTPDAQGVLQSDFDRDGDVDHDDFGVFQRCYRGPNLAMIPGCQGCY